MSTAVLLPDLHPWLKEYFVERHLVAITHEAWFDFPKWETVPEYREMTNGALSMVIGVEQETETVIPSPATSLREDHVDAAPVEAIPEQTRAPALVALLARHDAPRERQPIMPSTSPEHCTVRRTASLTGARRSSAPTLSNIPLAATADAPASTNLLRVIRRAPPLPTISQNLLPGQSNNATTPHLARHWFAWVTNTWRFARPSTPQPAERTLAPWPTIPSPFSELLIVNITAGPLEVLWRNIAWPLWQACHLPHPPAIAIALSEYASAARRQFRMLRLASRTVPAIAPGAMRLSPARLPSIHLAVDRTHCIQAAGFAIALLLALAPVKILGWGTGSFPAIRGQVLGATATTLDAFSDGGNAVAASGFHDAIAAFDRARVTLESLPADAGMLPRALSRIGRAIPAIGGTIARAEHARQGGIALANASATATRGIALLRAVHPNGTEAPALLDASAAAFTSAKTFADDATTHITAAAPTLTPMINPAVAALDRAEHLLPIVRALAGLDTPRRVLLVFQNPAELRPTGGFMGSVALVDVAAGTVRAFELPGGGSYDISGMTHIRVLPPEPLRLLTDTWQFHDANWFPDFPTTAAKIRWFYERSGGPTVDAVVAVNAPVLEGVLALTGPVVVDEHAFGATDVLAALTNTVESNGARASGKPKAILGQLAPELLRRITGLVTAEDASGSPWTESTRIALLDRLVASLESRDILLAFTDDAVQEHVAMARWDGAIRPTPHDSLMVVHTNIGGGKSDARIRDHVSHRLAIDENGSATATVAITRTHEGSADAAPSATPFDRLAGLQNVDYVRVYVPRGAMLVESDGFDTQPTAPTALPSDAIPDAELLAHEIERGVDGTRTVRVTEEFGRTAFGGWVLTPPGTSRTATLTYRLPWTIARTTNDVVGRTRPAPPQPYSLLVQKQPGTRATFQHAISVDGAWSVPWTAENLSRRDEIAWALDGVLATDLFTGLMIAPR